MPQVQVISLRAKSAHPRNYTNVDLHHCLDEAKGYRDQVIGHFTSSKYQNHALQSAERFYNKEEVLRPSSSQTSFNRRSKLSSRSSKEGGSTMYRTVRQRNKINPEGTVWSEFQSKTIRITQIKTGFDAGTEQKEYLRSRMQFLKTRMVQQKNKKSKISIRNCKLMNAAEISQHHINNLCEKSRRNNISINEVMEEVRGLEGQCYQLEMENGKLREEVEMESSVVNDVDIRVMALRKQLARERKLLQMWKQRQTVQFKQMQNKYMKMNQLKEQKAFLLNTIDVDHRNSYY